MDMTSVLCARELGLSRAGAAIVDDISFALPAGQLVMLVGPNGAGKSTLLHLLAGQLQPSRGGLTIAGYSSRAFARRDWAQKVTLVPQLTAMGFPLTVEEVVELGGLAHASSVVALRTQVQQALDIWDIRYLAGRDVRLLSGGEQQRCQLARSWVQMQQPESCLWLLDEPLSALDLRHQQQCMQHIQTLTAAGKTVVMVEHDLNLARRYADRVLLLSCGRLYADGDARSVLNAEQVSQVFRVDVTLDGDYLSWRG